MAINSSIPTSVTKGDSYTILGSYTADGLSGGSASCSSNLDGTITNTSGLTTVGTHTITCTAKTGAGKTATATKSLKITYTAYTATNLITDGSIEEGTLTKSYSLLSPTITTAKAKYGSKSLYVSSVINDHEIAYIMNSFSYVKDHKYYMSINSYVTSYTQGYVANLHIEGFGYLGFNPNILNQWNKTSVIYTATSTGTASDNRIGKCYNHTDAVWSAYLDGAIFIDLTTTFGSGNEPDQEWCDKHINYFDGTTTIYK